MSNFETATHATLVYDGDCPFCNNYVKLLRIKNHMALELVNARDDHEVVTLLANRGYDLDRGFVLQLSGKTYHGDECLNVLAMLSTPVDWFNRVNSAIFRHPRLARYLYPILRTARALTLRVIGIKPINHRH